MSRKIIFNIIQVLVVMIFSPLIKGVINRLKEWVQSKKGPSIFQPYLDIWKMFHKDEVVSEESSWIFRVTPYIRFYHPHFCNITYPGAYGLPAFFRLYG